MKVFFLILMALLLIGGGILLQRFGFDAIRKTRELARLPEGKVIGVIPGEVHLRGTTKIFNAQVHTPYTHAPCLHYSYTLEEETKDSDGDTSWKVRERKSESVPFLLNDETGQIVINPTDGIKWNLTRNQVNIDGKFRHTETYLQGGEVITLFGFAQANERGILQVGFQEPGVYVPIITTGTEVAERVSIVFKGVMMVWGALVCWSLATVVFCGILGAYRPMVYLVMLAVILGGSLAYFGYTMMHRDAIAAVERLKHQEEMADLMVQKEDGLPLWGNTMSPRRVEIRSELIASAKRTRETLYSFPENLFLPMWGLSGFEKQFPCVDYPLDNELRWKQKTARFSFLLAGSICAGALLVALIAAWFGFGQLRIRRFIDNVTTAKPAGISYGLAETVGVVSFADDDQKLVGPLSGQTCCYYHYKVEEKKGSGKNSKWVTLQDDKEVKIFYCRDESGQIRVDPQDAKIFTNHQLVSKDGDMRYTENWVQEGDQAYILGAAQVDPFTGSSLYITKPDLKEPFILANLPEQTIKRYYAKDAILWHNTSINTLILFALMLFGFAGSFAPSNLLLAGLVPVAYLALVMVVLVFNDLVDLRQRVRKAWANIDVSLKKRADLVPMLTQIAEAYFQHESPVQESLAQMRNLLGSQKQFSSAEATQFAQAEHHFTTSFIAIREAYPDLKASEVLSQTARTLTSLENEIALMREGYNNSVENYNTRCGKIPEIIYAKLFGFRQADFFNAPFEIQQVPKVNLS